MTGVSEHLTSAYHPQSNGLDERFNQTLQRQLLKFVEDEQKQWDLYLDSILFSYRVSRQDSTKFSPFFLVYGRQARLPVEFNLKPESTNSEEDLNADEERGSFNDYIAKMVTVRKKALENIKVAQKKQKYYYDKKHCRDNKMYEIGTLVLLRNSKKLSRKGSKMEPNWTGPYKVREILGKGIVKLSNRNGTKDLVSVYNVTRLKLYHERVEKDYVSFNYN